MRNTPNLKAECGRNTKTSDSTWGNNGDFYFEFRGMWLFCRVSDGASWDHISVSVDANPRRVPDYEEMCFVKDIFFRDDECAMQLHVPKADHVNCHPWTLHLWRPQTPEEAAIIEKAWLAAGEDVMVLKMPPGPIPRPPYWLVGLKAEQVEKSSATQY